MGVWSIKIAVDSFTIVPFTKLFWSVSRQEIGKDRRERRRESGFGERRFRGAESRLPENRSDRSKQQVGLITWLLGSRYDRGTMDEATREKLEDVYSYRWDCSSSRVCSGVFCASGWLSSYTEFNFFSSVQQGDCTSMVICFLPL